MYVLLRMCSLVMRTFSHDFLKMYLQYFNTVNYYSTNTAPGFRDGRTSGLAFTVNLPYTYLYVTMYVYCVNQRLYMHMYACSTQVA